MSMERSRAISSSLIDDWLIVESMNVEDLNKEVKLRSVGFTRYIGKPFVLRSVKNRAFVLDTAGHQYGGGPTHLWEYGKGNVNQVWTVDRLGRLISWQNRNSILYAKALTNGTPPTIVGIKGNPSADKLPARWILDGEFIRSMANANQVLDVAGAKMVNATPIIVHECHGGPNQRWIIELV